MTLYSLNGSYPKPLPNRIRLSNGLTKTDNTTFTDSDLSDAGYTLAGDIPDTPSGENFTKLEWSPDSKSWVYRTTPNQAEINEQWAIVREQRNEMLKEADIRTLMAIERSTSAPFVNPYKDALRNIPDLNDDPFNINWPVYGDADSDNSVASNES